MRLQGQLAVILSCALMQWGGGGGGRDEHAGIMSAVMFGFALVCNVARANPAADDMPVRGADVLHLPEAHREEGRVQSLLSARPGPRQEVHEVHQLLALGGREPAR
jgi:hypothetical protein